MCPVPPARAEITFGQLDTFQDGTTMGWSEGFNSPNPPTNASTGGPGGAGDRFLRNASSGGFGAGSRQVTFNDAQWVGNFTTAGVTRLEAQMANLGSTTLHMRVALRGGPGFTSYASTAAAVLPADGVWRPVVFDLTAAAMSNVSGGADSLTDVLSNVMDFRVLSASSGPTFSGADPIASTLGMDNVRALRLPGDADFSGTVDVTDLGVLATNFNQGGDWADGDFSFDGQVNVTDLGVLATNFNKSINAAASPPDAVSFEQALTAYPQLAAAFPEPGGLGMVCAAGAVVALVRRRRRQTRG
jgi:hypothetical protein